MNTLLQTNYEKDLANKKIIVHRTFNAPLDLVWQAWTEKEILDQWWAPKPWKTQTKSMNFTVGGSWIYIMQGPEGEMHWSRADYKAITPQKSFIGVDCFCDENGVRNEAFPTQTWQVNFEAVANATNVKVEMTFEKVEDLQKIVEMGFEQGFAMAHENLDQYLEAKFKLQNQNKTNNRVRTSTYLNFPGNTEEAFTFYKSVFGGQFSGKGLQRFGDIPAEAGHPPVADSIKKMVLHVELTILGGHVLMATDAPKEFGMTVTQGNNMHICLEPETKEETKRLFEGLSQGGNIIMPLADMFFGAYFGSCTDKFGINWMFNCVEKK